MVPAKPRSTGRDATIWRRGPVCVLLILLCGCSPYRAGVLPASDASPATGRSTPDAREPVEVGSEVRLVLAGGEVVAGEVARITPAAVVVTWADNYGPHERTVTRDEVASVQVKAASPAVNAVLIGVTVVLATVTIALGSIDWGAS